jgi:DNA-binding NarL/FixJ family response regulator
VSGAAHLEARISTDLTGTLISTDFHGSDLEALVRVELAAREVRGESGTGKEMPGAGSPEAGSPEPGSFGGSECICARDSSPIRIEDRVIRVSQKPASMIHVLIAIDDAASRARLRSLASSSTITVIPDADSAMPQGPDVVIVDERSATTADGDIAPAILVVGDAETAIRKARAGRGGAWGVVSASADATQLRGAIAAVAAGLVVLPPALATGAAHPADPIEDDAIEEALTARELDVLALVSQGLSNREVARELGISEHTVKFHLAAIYGKLDASTRTEAVRRALRRGLIHL